MLLPCKVIKLAFAGEYLFGAQRHPVYVLMYTEHVAETINDLAPRDSVMQQLSDQMNEKLRPLGHAFDISRDSYHPGRDRYTHEAYCLLLDAINSVRGEGILTIFTEEVDA